MDRDRTLKAYFSTPAPDDPRDFLDDYDIKVAAQQADEFGQPIEGGTARVTPYDSPRFPAE